MLKLLSVDPGNYRDAPVEAIRRVLEQATGKRYAKDLEKISLEGVGKSFLKSASSFFPFFEEQITNVSFLCVGQIASRWELR